MKLRILSTILLCIFVAVAFGQGTNEYRVDTVKWGPQDTYRFMEPIDADGDIGYYFIELTDKDQGYRIEKRDAELNKLASGHLLSTSLYSDLTYEDYRSEASWLMGGLSDDKNTLNMYFVHKDKGSDVTYLLLAKYNAKTLDIKSIDKVAQLDGTDERKTKYFGDRMFDLDQEQKVLSFVITEGHDDKAPLTIRYASFDMNGKELVNNKYTTTRLEKSRCYIDNMHVLKNGHVVIFTSRDKGRIDQLYGFNPAGEEAETLDWPKMKDVEHMAPEIVDVDDDDMALVGIYYENKTTYPKGYYVAKLNPKRNSIKETQYYPFTQEMIDMANNGRMKRWMHNDGTIYMMHLNKVLTNGDGVLHILASPETVIAVPEENGELYVSRLDLNADKPELKTSVVYRHGYDAYGYVRDYQAWLDDDGTVKVLRYEHEDNVNVTGFKGITRLLNYSFTYCGIVLSTFPMPGKGDVTSEFIEELSWKGFMIMPYTFEQFEPRTFMFMGGGIGGPSGNRAYIGRFVKK